MNKQNGAEKRPARRLPAEGEAGRYFDYLRDYPRANPGREFINGAGTR
jgi:hypothetical protein